MKNNKSKPTAGHIVALGGCGFSVETDNTLIDDFVLSLSSRQPARVCFVPTASADSAAYTVKFYRAFSERAIPTDLTIFDPSSPARNPARTSDLEQFIDKQDIIYVGGGNTVNLLAIWQAHGIDKILRNAWARGAVLCGVSAGMICWFRGGITDSYGELDILNDGLALIDAFGCPHYDSESERRSKFHAQVKAESGTGYAADDMAALHFQGANLVEAIASHQGAYGYQVSVVDDVCVEQKLNTRVLVE